MSDAESLPPDETLLNFYEMLVDQLHKNSTLLWQIPTALFAANAFAMDKFESQPLMVLFLAVFDLAMAYACLKVRLAQREIIASVRLIEQTFCKTSFSVFTPRFPKSSISAPDLIVWLLFAVGIAMLVYFVVSISR